MRNQNNSYERILQKLKERGERFLVDAELDFESKEYDVALFHVEQAVQLFLKGKSSNFWSSHTYPRVICLCPFQKKTLKRLSNLRNA